jgi:hypothetical protein
MALAILIPGCHSVLCTRYPQYQLDCLPLYPPVHCNVYWSVPTAPSTCCKAALCSWCPQQLHCCCMAMLGCMVHGVFAPLVHCSEARLCAWRHHEQLHRGCVPLASCQVQGGEVAWDCSQGESGDLCSSSTGCCCWAAGPGPGCIYSARPSAWGSARSRPLQ